MNQIAELKEENRESTEMLNKVASTKSLTNLGLPDFYRRIDRNIVDKVVQFGYPREMVIKSLKHNMSNHCTTAYYLLCMNQQF